MNTGALGETELAQTSANLKDKLLKLDERQVRVAGHFKVGPFLVDLLLGAVDDLLDFSVLDMGRDQGARADALGVAKQLGASSQDVECGRDVVGRASDELVLGGWVAARDGLAFDGLVAGCFDGEGRALDHARLEGGEVLLRHAGGCVDDR